MFQVTTKSNIPNNSKNQMNIISNNKNQYYKQQQKSIF